MNATVQNTLAFSDVGLVMDAVIVEDHKELLPTGHFLRMTAVDMPINSIALTVHSQGSWVNISQTFTVEGTWDQTKLAVVAWVQNSNTREVLQAGIAYPPTSKPPTTNMPPQYVGGDLDFSMEENAVDNHINVAKVFNDPDGDALTYTTEGSLEPDYAVEVFEFNRTIHDSVLDDIETVRLLRENGVSHVYIGEKGGNFQVQSLANSPCYDLAYHENGVWIFELVGACTG